MLFPKKIGKFKADCVENVERLQRDEPKKNKKRAKKNTVKWEDSDEKYFANAHLLYPTSPASSVGEQLSRMVDDNVDYTGFGGTILNTLNARDKQV